VLRAEDLHWSRKLINTSVTNPLTHFPQLPIVSGANCSSVVAKASCIERVRSGLYTGLAPKARSCDLTSYQSRGSFTSYQLPQVLTPSLTCLDLQSQLPVALVPYIIKSRIKFIPTNKIWISLASTYESSQNKRIKPPRNNKLMVVKATGLAMS
jgi:hypothetical protein